MGRKNSRLVNISKIFLFLLATIGLGIFIFYIVFAYLPSEKFKQKSLVSIDLKEETIGGLKLGASLSDKDFIDGYGEGLPYAYDNVYYDYLRLTDKITIAREKDDDKIIRFINMDRNISTARGIKIGDGKEEVIELYGKDYYQVNNSDQGHFIAYIDRDMKFRLKFQLEEDRVSLFYLDYMDVI